MNVCENTCDDTILIINDWFEAKALLRFGKKTVANLLIRFIPFDPCFRMSLKTLSLSLKASIRELHFM